MNEKRRPARSKSGVWPMRVGEPPPPAFFAEERPTLGDSALSLVFGPLSILLEGLDAEHRAILAARYGPFVAEPPADPLRVRVARDEREYFLEPADGPEFTAVFLACDGKAVRYLSYRVAGRFDAGPGGRGDLLLARGAYEPPLRAFENYIRAATAWQAATRGGALVHGAGLVRNGRGYLFFGESGAGKSTLAASTRRATVVSDDLSLCLPRAVGGLDLVGSPFRGTHEEGEPVVGRFPLAAAFRLEQAPEARVVEAPRVLLFGQLVGNLTFVAEGFGARPDLFARVERAFEGVPLRRLRFTTDDSFWDAIDGAGL